MAVIQVLRETRRDQGITQEGLAQMTGGILSQPTLSRIESGKQPATVPEWLALCKALGLSPVEVLRSVLP